MKKKLTQKEMTFYVLYKAFKKEPERFVPAWEFVGEVFVEELQMWAFMSYKTPANGVAIYFENPGLIERQTVRGKSGAKYYAYRIAPNPSAAKIADASLLAFYRKIATV